jgi:hypothetical protein
MDVALSQNMDLVKREDYELGLGMKKRFKGLKKILA